MTQGHQRAPELRRGGTRGPPFQEGTAAKPFRVSAYAGARDATRVLRGDLNCKSTLAAYDRCVELERLLRSCGQSGVFKSARLHAAGPMVFTYPGLNLADWNSVLLLAPGAKWRVSLCHVVPVVRVLYVCSCSVPVPR